MIIKAQMDNWQDAADWVDNCGEIKETILTLLRENEELKRSIETTRWFVEKAGYAEKLQRVATAAEYVCSLRPEPLPTGGIPELKEALKALRGKEKP